MKQLLTKLNACSEAISEYGSYELGTAYKECNRGDWMLWFAAKIGIDRKRIVLAACDCASLAPQSEIGRKAIETARRWVADECNLEDVKRAAYAAYAAAAHADAAAYAANAADAAYATDAAAAATTAAAAATYAADAADAATYAADAATYAAYASADAAYAAAKKDEVLKQCADIFRKYISLEDIKNCIGEKHDNS